MFSMVSDSAIRQLVDTSLPPDTPPELTLLTLVATTTLSLSVLLHLCQLLAKGYRPFINAVAFSLLTAVALFPVIMDQRLAIMTSKTFLFLLFPLSLICHGFIRFYGMLVVYGGRDNAAMVIVMILVGLAMHYDVVELLVKVVLTPVAFYVGWLLAGSFDPLESYRPVNGAMFAPFTVLTPDEDLFEDVSSGASSSDDASSNNADSVFDHE
ncbi:Uu.00g086220.m01.CDS01 [Anthostomella pinea]|uniref:Uu.00g086220.m01.CDS01 n=1 Tax=Anthostomella pinea TaxID=933095 RepID=A0AAI8VN15_9PEZI|nr:Uu.00g086220.m01.CDS01 [Anthostomella pinea]